MSLIPSSLKATLRDRRTREFIFWMLPALLVGLALRIVLTVQLPYAYYHDDSPDFLTTPDRLLHEHRFELHEKKTFLVPILYTPPFYLKVPALITIPLFQHVLGLALVVLVGALCRLWFRYWRVFIVPLTLLTAANPFFLWYEHTLMAEPVFIFCTALVALAGTLYAQDQSRGRFYFLLAALFLEAGARPEGKLLFGFGLFLIVLLHSSSWRLNWPRLAIITVLMVVTHFATKTSQAGLLLYTSVVRFTPAELNSAPGFDPYIAPIREDLQRRWDEKPQFPKVRDRRAVAGAVEKYLTEHEEMTKGKKHLTTDKFCLKLAKETCLRRVTVLPAHVYHKFRAAANDSPSGRLDNDWLFGRQKDAYRGSLKRSLALAPEITGQPSTTLEELEQFVDTHYGEVPWFNRWLDTWLAAVNRYRFPDLRVPNPDYPTVAVYHFGVPYYFLIAAIGLVAVALRRGPLQAFHIAWGLTMLAFFYTIMLTANVRPRFRVVFEPFWFIYIALLAECIWLAVTFPFRRRE
ncbi:MAG: hypothetical protein WCF18_00475 [Chthoniobacteraceae bacterium]